MVGLGDVDAAGRAHPAGRRQPGTRRRRLRRRADGADAADGARVRARAAARLRRRRPGARPARGVVRRPVRRARAASCADPPRWRPWTRSTPRCPTSGRPMRHTLRAGDPERLAIGSRLVRSMSWYWYRHRFAVEARYWHERLMDVLGDEDSAPMVQSLHGAALGLLQQGHQDRRPSCSSGRCSIARRIGDKSLEARELNSLGLARTTPSDRETALRLLRESLAAARDAGEPSRESTALTNLAVLLTDEGDYAAAPGGRAEASIALDTRAPGTAGGIAVNEVNRPPAVCEIHGARAAHAHLSEVAGWIVDLGDDDLVADRAGPVRVRAGRAGGAGPGRPGWPARPRRYRTSGRSCPPAAERRLVERGRGARVAQALGRRAVGERVRRRVELLDSGDAMRSAAAAGRRASARRAVRLAAGGRPAAESGSGDDVAGRAGGHHRDRRRGSAASDSRRSSGASRSRASPGLFQRHPVAHLGQHPRQRHLERAATGRRASRRRLPSGRARSRRCSRG